MREAAAGGGGGATGRGLPAPPPPPAASNHAERGGAATAASFESLHREAGGERPSLPPSRLPRPGQEGALGSWVPSGCQAR